MIRRCLLLSVLSLCVCTGWSPVPEVPVWIETKQALPIEVEGDEPGVHTCSGGGCNLECEGACKATCSGGGCNHLCLAGECEFTCSGGGCNQACAAGSKCGLTCSGGGCNRACDEATCGKTCAGGGCDG